MPGLDNGPVNTETVRSGWANIMDTEGAKAGAWIGQQPCATGQLLCSHSCWCISNERGKTAIESIVKRHTSKARLTRPMRCDIQ